MVAASATRMLVLSSGPLVLLLVACDIVHSLVIRRALLPGWEATVSTALAMLLVCAAVMIATMFEAVAVWASTLVTTRVRGRFAGLVAPILAAAAGSPLLMLLARQPFIGNRYRDTPVATYGPWVVLVMLMLVVIAGLWLGARLLSWFVSSPNSQRLGRWGLGSVLVAAFVALVIADSLWYAGWYPLVHTVLSAASLLIAHVLLVLTLLRWPQARVVSRIATGFVGVAVIAALPVATVWSNQTVQWRVATGTLFASRVIFPTLRLSTQPLAIRDLDTLPSANSRDLVPHPAVTGVPPALASNGLLVTVDALRFDTLGVNGSSRNLTPHIDAFFAHGQVFERAYSQYASTRNSVRAILESRFRDQRQQGNDLINRLRDYGFQVIAVLPTDMKIFVNVERYNFSTVAFYEDPTTIIPVLNTLIGDVPAERRFVWVHLYQPHDPYEPPTEFGSGTSSRELYEGEVRWVDSDFADIVSVASAPSDIVMFGADHGEEFGEHGGTLHGRTAYDETIRVPLAITAPGVGAMNRRELVGNVDIAPTILAALGIPVPDEYEGYDLLGRASVAPGDRVVYSETVTNGVAALRDQWKWIHWTDFDLWEAYDLKSDPRELRNLADQEHVMAPGRALVTLFELPWHILPRLRNAGSAEYTQWLQGVVERNGRSSSLGRWAGFQIATTHASDSGSRALLEKALQMEQEPALKLALMDSVGPVKLQNRVAVPPLDGRDSGLLIEMLRHPEIAVDPPRFIRSAMAHPISAVRARAAEQLALTEPSAAAEALTGPHADTAILRGLLKGLATRPADVSRGVFRSFVAHGDVDVRVAALMGVILQEKARAVPFLEELRGIEKSPSVVRVILDGLLGLDREKGLAALRNDIGHPMLSDYDRAQLIATWNVTEEADHLVKLFVQSESGAFRNYLFTAASRLRAPQRVITNVVQAMSANAFEPALRARIASYLRNANSPASRDQNDKPGVSREE